MTDMASRATTPASPSRPRYSIATLVNDAAHYEKMLASFQAGGFTERGCEFLRVDNTGSAQTCAYRGLNRLLDAARGTYIILCHQDVRIVDGRAELDQRLVELDTKDPDWALAGNAGGVAPGELAIRITDPHGADRRIGVLPRRVMSLDENFIVVKREARLGFSRDLSGFHLYGADICLIADILGHSTYVIDFHLQHLSAGRKDDAYAAMERAFRAKWSNALRTRWLQTTCSLIRLSGDTLGQMLGRLAEAPLAAISRRLGATAISSRAGS